MVQGWWRPEYHPPFGERLNNSTSGEPSAARWMALLFSLHSSGYSMETRAFSDVIRQLRLDKGMQLRTLSELTGLDNSLLSRFEKGERLPTRSQLPLLAKALDADLNALSQSWYCERVLVELDACQEPFEVLRMAGLRLSKPESAEPFEVPALQPLLERWQAMRDKESDAYRRQSDWDAARESMAISGYAFSPEEAHHVLFHRKSLTGKGLNEQMALLNLAEAQACIRRWAMQGETLNLELTNRLHVLLLRGVAEVGRFRDEIAVLPGTAPLPPAPQHIQAAMENLLSAYERESNAHPVYRAAALHYRFIQTHPYADANGRVARLLMQFSILKAGYPLVLFCAESAADSYFQTLEQSWQTQSPMPLARAVAGWVQDSLDAFFHAASSS
jgi:transcriptional regulator with XRE-family HTH domain/fido (protein-threonine AMPylation protein)